MVSSPEVAQPPLTAVWEADPDLIPAFDDVYAQHFAFVWRSLRRLGVAPAWLSDAAQDVFLVVHRRLPDFEGRAPLRSWLYGIAVRVAQEHRRTRRRRELTGVKEPDTLAGAGGLNPDQMAERRQALELVETLLSYMDGDKREAFVLAELEGLSVPEVSLALGANINTIYSRLRSARREFEQLLARHQASARRCP